MNAAPDATAGVAVAARSASLPPQSEQEALEDARRGDAAAFGRLVRLHQGRVRRQLRRLTGGDSALADDLAQDTFVQAWGALDTFRGEARLSTWLHRLAYSRFLMHRRAAAARLPAAPSGPDVEPAEDHVVADGHDRAAEGTDPSLRLDLQRALATLSLEEHDALAHCVALELTLDEAAEVLAVPLGTLKSRLTKARERLRQALADWNPKEAA